MKIVKCEIVNAQTVLTVTGADVRWLKSLSVEGSDCRIVPGNASVSVAGGLVYGHYAQVKAVQGLILSQEKTNASGRFDFGSVPISEQLTPSVRRRVAVEILAEYEAYVKKQNRTNSLAEAFNVSVYVQDVYGATKVPTVDPVAEMERFKFLLADADSVAEAMEIASDFVDQCKEVTS